MGHASLPWRRSDHEDVDGSPPEVLVNFGVASACLPGAATAVLRVWVDCIAWLRAATPPCVQDYDFHFSEAFFGSTALGDSTVTLVRPLLNVPKAAAIPSARNDVVLALGGMHTPYLKEEFLADWAGLHVEALVQAELGRTVVLLPTSLIDAVRRRVTPRDAVDIYPLADSADWHRLLASAECVLLQPGLYGPFEAFTRAARSRLLAPYSWTQVHQLQRFMEAQLVDTPPPWWEAMSSGLQEALRLPPDVASEPLVCDELSGWFEDSDRDVLRIDLLQWLHRSGTAPLPAHVAQARIDHVSSWGDLPHLPQLLAELL